MQGVDYEKQLRIHEQMMTEFAHDPELAAQWQLKEQEELVRPDDLSYEAQCALTLFNILPDKIEGMSGAWMGKDFSGLFDIMNIYRMSNQIDVLEHLHVCISEASEHYAQQRKLQEQRSKK